MNLAQALAGARALAAKYRLAVVVYWRGGNRYGFATEHRLLAGKQRLARWRWRVFPDGTSERL
jgi:hypothetical protein